MKPTRFPPLRQERERRGWSRNYVAEQIEVDVITVGRWERGERMPHPQYKQKLCDLFKMSAQELGLFSEISSELANNTIILDLSQQALDERSIAANTREEAELSDRAIVYTEEYQSAVLASEKAPVVSMSLLRHRRTFLLGLAGLGALALLGSRVLATPQVSRTSTDAQIQVPLSKRLHHFLDQNSSNWVNHLAWSPDSSSFAVATGSNVVSIWNIEKETIILYYPTLNGWVNDVSWSKTNWIAAANADQHGGSLQLWNFPQTVPVLTLKRPYGLRSVTWSPDSKHLAFSGHAPVIEVWDPFAGRQISQYSDSTLGLMGITRVKWSPSGKFLACATDDNTAHVWEALTGKPVTIYHGHQNRVHDLDWSPDERYIVSAGADTTCHIWEALSGQAAFIYHGNAGIVEGVTWSPRGNHIGTAHSNFTAHIWEPFTGKLVALYGEYDNIVETVLWTKDGSMLAIGSEKNGVEIWPAP